MARRTRRDTSYGNRPYTGSNSPLYKGLTNAQAAKVASQIGGTRRGGTGTQGG